jgi:hypothetical protein
MFAKGKVVAFVGAAALLAACQDIPGPESAAARASAGGRSASSVASDPVPDQLAVAQVVPGFGGYYLDADGRPVARLVDSSRRADAEAALAGFLSDRGFSASDLRIASATYDYTQLDSWHNASWPAALAVSGAVFSDIDEGANRLRFGAVDAAAALNVAAAVAAAGVPQGAFSVELSAPIENMHTLRDAVRPVHGGYQLNFLDAAGVRTVSFLCTMGFNVVKDGRASFITNSHCTNHQGGTETPTEYYQPTMDPDGDRLVNREYFIATEVDDPHYDAVSCAMEVLPGTVCRYSDAARAEYAAGVPFTLGRIARTTEGYQDTPFTHDPITGDRIRNPVLTVDSLNPTFSIKGEQRASVLGEIVHKVGRTTGWTFGPVIQTCLNSVVLGTVPAIVQRCQDRVRADVAGGDSGSPVFRRLGNGSNVRLSGILWGGSVSGEVTFVFSPMANVRQELGNFSTH